MQSTDPPTFAGSCKDIDAILGLKVERVQKKLHYILFIERDSNYAIANYKFDNDIEPVVRNIHNPTQGFEKKYRPISLTTDNHTFDDPKKSIKS